MHHLYILKSQKDGTFYTGITKDIARRLSEHNNGRNRSTRNKAPWRLAYKESFTSRQAARTRETFFKSGEGRELRKQIMPG